MILKNRNCECNISGFLFTTIDTENSKGLTIKWSYDIKDYDSPAKLKLEIYNPAREVVDNIKQLDPVTFGFGYNGEINTFFSGFLDTYEYKEDGVDKVLKVTCIEQADLIFKDFSVSYNAETSGEYIIKDLAKRSGLIIKQLDIKRNKNYMTGFCAYGKPLNEIREVVEDCESKLKIEGKELYIYIDEINKNQAVVLDYTSGLLEEPQTAVKSVYKETQKEESKRKEALYTHKVKSLAIPLIKKNSIIVANGEIHNITGQVIQFKINNNYEAEYFIRKR